MLLPLFLRESRLTVSPLLHADPCHANSPRNVGKGSGRKKLFAAIAVTKSSVFVFS